MNRLFITGNATREPELRTTQNGKSVCVFTLAVNRRKRTADGQTDTDFFRVTTWDQLAENCAKYVVKGKKVAVLGSVSVHPYANAKGEPCASLELNANEVEFLSARSEDGMTKVEVEDNPFDRELPY